MANANAPMGLRPVRHRNGAPYNGACSRYYVPSTDGTALYIGDPVVVNGAGDSAGVPVAIKATAGGGNYITGVVVGFEPADGANSPNLNQTYRTASTARYILVADDPDLVLEIQEDSVGAALGTGAPSSNADFVDGTGSTVTGLSGVMLDSSTSTTTNTLQLKIIRAVPRADNEIGNYCKWEVMINLHTQRYTTGI